MTFKKKQKEKIIDIIDQFRTIMRNNQVLDNYMSNGLMISYNFIYNVVFVYTQIITESFLKNNPIDMYNITDIIALRDTLTDEKDKYIKMFDDCFRLIDEAIKKKGV